MNEKTSPWFKAFALCTAIGLGGTYVWRQQQKAAPQIEKPVQRMVLSGSKSAVITETSLSMDQEKARQPAMLPSSKSLVIDPSVLPVDEKKTNLPAIQQELEAEERILMPSSKSGIVSPRPQIHVAPRQRTLLPGSKSIDPILKLPQADKP